MLEEMAPEIEREEAEAKDAQEFLQMLEQTYADAGTKLKQARSELERAQRDMSVPSSSGNPLSSALRPRVRRRGWPARPAASASPSSRCRMRQRAIWHRLRRRRPRPAC